MVRRTKAAENDLAFGRDDAFDYVLALELGWSHAAVQALPNDEYVRWQAFMNLRHTFAEHEEKVAAMRSRP